MRWLITILIVHSFGAGLAQSDVAVADLGAVGESGFYRIPLSPKVRSLAALELNNVRIKDAAGQEIPYLLKADAPVFTETAYKEYPIKKEIVPGCCTSITLENTDKRMISNISLSIKNAEVTKNATLTGSDDGSQWFILKDKFVLGNFNDVRGTSELHVLGFPLSDYRFFRLVISDSSSAPINIERAGYYESFSKEGEHTSVASSFSVTQLPDKRTRVVIEPDTVNVVDRVGFTIGAPALYFRRATIYVETEVKVKGKTQLREEWVGDFNIRSTHPAVESIVPVKTGKLIAYIENGDNPPLTISSIQLFQQREYLVAWLEAGKQYALVVTSPDVASPSYDLEYFNANVPDMPAELELGNIVTYTAPRSESFTLFTDRNIIWASIIAVAALLAYMSVRMIRKTDPVDETKSL